MGYWDMTKYIRKQKNTYYIDFAFPFNNAAGATRPLLANGFELNFPLGTQNIKANHALISVDKMALRGGEIVQQEHYPLIFQTSIPCANKFTTILDSDGSGTICNWDDPKLASYSENINLTPIEVIGAADNARISFYDNTNTDRKVLVPNPMGKSFKCRLMTINNNTGLRQVAANISHTVSMTIRVELLEEEIL
jgi:hypothetical protein